MIGEIPIPPTMWGVFRVEPGDGGVPVLSLVGEFMATMVEAEVFARSSHGTCVVIKMTPISAFRGRPD